MSRLPYHQLTYDLLGIEPAVSLAALRQIRDCEQRCGRKLPEALREWLALEPQVWERLIHTSPNLLLLPVEEVLRQFEVLSDPQVPLERRYVRVSGDDHGIEYEYLHLDGSENPPVVGSLTHCDFTEGDGTGEDLDFSLRADTFSDEIFCSGWWSKDEDYRGQCDDATRYPGFWLHSTRDEQLLPPAVDYLIDHFEQNTCTDLGDGLIRYEFVSPGHRLSVVADELTREDGCSAWRLNADTEEQLRQLTRWVWPWGDLRHTLRAFASATAERVLAGLR